MSAPDGQHEGMLDEADHRRVLDQLDIWRKQLINLARSNRLLYFRHTRTSTLEIVDQPEKLAAIVAGLLTGKVWHFYEPTEEEWETQENETEIGASDRTASMFPESALAREPAGDELRTSKKDSRELRSTLRTLDRRATQEFMDKGIWILYLAVGILQWTDPDSREQAESPLVLLPVQLQRQSPREPYELRRADEDIVLNPALGVKLAEFGVELPMVEEDDLDFTTTLAAFDAAIVGKHGWEVERRLVISPFSFYKEVMYRDLLHNQEAVSTHKLIQALAVGAREGSALGFEVVPEDRLDEQVPPEKTVTILNADAAQMQCIAAAAAGRSFVMDGPPGTGKSQTIANIIAELLAKGKTILFVSEKAAALEVVQKRLWAAGLSDYCLQLHSHKATRKEVAQQLGRALVFHPTVPPAMADTDLSQLRRRRQELSERATAMNEVRQPLGRSLHDVIGRVSQLHHLPQAPPPTELGSSLSAEALSVILSATGEIARAWGPVARGDEFVWRNLADVVLDATRTQRTHSQIRAASESLTKLVGATTGLAETLLRPAPSDFEASEALARVLRHLEARPAAIPAQWLSCSDFSEVEALGQGRRQLALACGRAEKALLEALGSRWREISASSASRFGVALAQLRSLEPSFAADDSFPSEQFGPLFRFVADTGAMLQAAMRDAPIVAAPFGLPASEITLKRAAELTELALLTAEPIRPEAAWISPSVIAEVEQAARKLQPLCTVLNERRAQLSEVFNDDVLTLNLEGLCQRFQSIHRGLGKLRGAYRLDKQAVAQVSRVGKATKDVLGCLPLALEWQRITVELKAAEDRQADLLGTYYYQSTATDFDSIGRALESARRSIEIAGEHLNVEAMRRQLARGGDPDADVLPVAARLKTSIEDWRVRASSLFGAFAETLLTTELQLLASWCTSALSPLGDLAEEASIVADVAGRSVTMEELRRWLDARAQVATIEATLSENADDDRKQLGVEYQVLDTNWDLLDASMDWTAALRQLLPADVTPGSAERLVSVDLDWNEVNEALDDWHRARDGVVAIFTDERAVEVRSDLGTTFQEAQELLDHMVATIGDIDEWVEFQRARAALQQLKVGNVIDYCESARVVASEVSDVVERACLERWADAVIDEDMGRLRQLRSDQLDPVVVEFRELDRELIRRAGSKAVAACNARRPRTTLGAAGIIKREAEKQRRHMPVRKLLEQTAEVAQLLKPCFMMSPLTVSQFLPSSLHFDAVIFDEASQVRPCDAINCIYRGPQLVIAGDDKQLPPTSFFEAVSVDGDDEWEEDQFEDFESIIKLGKGSGGLEELPLTWHYRSQHEDLIAYSNFSFYDGRLITFPGSTAEANDLGVKLFHVQDGVYRRGTARDNPREAEVVVDRVLHWAKHSLDHPAEAVSLGAVAFSEAQAQAIEATLDRRRKHLPELDAFFSEDRLDGFFVKNLENVQGDERDVMIFSVGYGKDEVGKLTMNFGPLNREGGERRLNVAITRARRRVELVASITGTEAEFPTSLRDGPRHLQRYLDYAQRGPLALAIDVGEEQRDAESPFEEEVLRTINSWGYKAKPQVGTAGYRVDIGVWHPSIAGRFALGIECDGRMYHSSRVARDRDRLRQEVLESLGWRIYRVWGTSWYRYRREQEERLKAAIEAAVQGTGALSPGVIRKPKNSDTRLDEQFESVSLDATRSWTVPYRVASPNAPLSFPEMPNFPEMHSPEAVPYLQRMITDLGFRLEMHLPEAVPYLQRMIIEVVEAEGPIEDELLLRRVREAWGVGRAGYRIRDNFFSALEKLVQRGTVRRLETSFTYIKPDQLSQVRVPSGDPLSARSVAQVSRRERVSAIKHLIDEAHRVSRDELTFEVCRLFGWNRRGSDIAAALEEAIDKLIRKGTINEEDGFLKIN
jgi:very-short-patch-repair endonuclease